MLLEYMKLYCWENCPRFDVIELRVTGHQIAKPSNTAKPATNQEQFSFHDLQEKQSGASLIKEK